MIGWANRVHDRGFRGHQHLLTNMPIDLDGDEAHAETYVTILARDSEGWGSSQGGGRYLDRLERRHGRWG